MQQSTTRALSILCVSGIMILAGFVFVTTEAFDISIGSKQWVFYLCLSALFLVAAAIDVFRSKMHNLAKAVCFLVVMGLSVSITILGVQSRPFDPAYTPGRLGYRSRDPNDGISFEIQTEDDENTVLLKEHSDSLFMPNPIDQGSCGSCWAVASAQVLSARFARLRASQGKPIPVASTTCASRGIDTSGWYASPQFFLDKAAMVGSSDICSSKSYGKCGGNTAVAGFLLAANGVPSDQCVPYFAGKERDANTGQKMCLTSCGSPSATYPVCPITSAGATQTECIHSDSFEWTQCSDPALPMNRLLTTKGSPKYFAGSPLMKSEIVNGGPIVCSIGFATHADNSQSAWTLYDGSGYKTITSGFIAKPETNGTYDLANIRPSHLLTIYGFGTTTSGVPYWEVRNSWGSSWGNKGNIKIIRDVNAWGIESECASVGIRDV